LYCVFSLFQILNAKLIVITQGVTCVSCISCKKMSSRFKLILKKRNIKIFVITHLEYILLEEKEDSKIKFMYNNNNLSYIITASSFSHITLLSRL